MGVKSCCRKGCDEIMCFAYVDDIGYICRDCVEEFKLIMTRKGHAVDNILLIRYIDNELTKFVKDNEKMLAVSTINLNEYFDWYSLE